MSRFTPRLSFEARAHILERPRVLSFEARALILSEAQDALAPQDEDALSPFASS
jgi:hypothetical protein